MKRLLSETGSTMIEFSLILPIFFLILAGIADYSFYIHQEMELTEAAAAGAGFGATPGQQENTAGMKAVATQAAPDVPGLTVTATYFYTCTPGGAVVASAAVCSVGFDSTPLMYVQVATSATVPAALHWAGTPNSLALQGQATYRVPWTK